MKHKQIVHMVTLSLLTTIVVVLQLLGGSIMISGVSVTLVLVPIVVGASIYGVKDGAFLGAVFGLITFINCMRHNSPFEGMLFDASPWFCGLVCMVKATAAGYVAALVQKLLYKWKSKGLLSYMGAAIAAPVVNTAIFACGMILFFRDAMNGFFGDTKFMYNLFVLVIGVNFFAELAVNLICAPAIATIVKAAKKN